MGGRKGERLRMQVALPKVFLSCLVIEIEWNVTNSGTDSGV